jgi:hypothetical protein
MRSSSRLFVLLTLFVLAKVDLFAFQAPKNDLKSNAHVVEFGPNGNYFSKLGEFTTKAATGEEFRLSGWGDRATRSVWFKFVAPTSDRVIITVNQATTGAPKGYIQLGVFDGEKPVESKTLGYPSDSEELISSQFITGRTYFLVVDNPTEGEELGAFSLKFQTFLMTACAQPQTVALNSNGQGLIDKDALFKTECYWPCTGIGCTRELSQTKFDAKQLGDNYITVTGLGANGKTYFGTLLVKVIDTIPPTIVAKDFRLNILRNGEVHVDPKNVILWRCKKTASEPSPDPSPDSGENTFFQEIPCSKDNVGIERFEVSKSVFTCDDIGVNEVIATVTDASGNKASTKVNINVVDLIPLTIKAKTVSLYIDENGYAKLDPNLLDDGSASGCTGFESSASKTVFDFNEMGDNSISYIIKNQRGDMLATTAVVKVNDTIAPTVVSQEVRMFANMKGPITITDASPFLRICPDVHFVPKSEAGDFVPDGSVPSDFFEALIERQGCTRDNGLISEIWIEPREFSSSDLGVNEVEVFVSDNAGNIASAKAKLTLVKPELPCKQQLWAIASGDWNDPNIWSDKPNGTSIGAVPCSLTTANIEGFTVTVQNEETIEIESIRLLNSLDAKTELNIYAGQINMKRELYSESNTKMFKHKEAALEVIKK